MRYRAEIHRTEILIIEFEWDGIPTPDDVLDVMSDPENIRDTWTSDEKVETITSLDEDGEEVDTIFDIIRN